MTSAIRSVLNAAAPSVAVVLFMLSRGHAATITWSGNGSDTSISNAGNWSVAQVPANGDTLIFAGTNSLAPDLTSGLTIASLMFDSTAGAFSIGGTAALTINSGITNN